MLARHQLIRLAGSALRALPVASRAYLGTQPSDIFVRKNRHLFKLMDATGDGILDEKDMLSIADRMKANSKLNPVSEERLRKSISSWYNASISAIGKTGSITEEDYVNIRQQKWNAPEGEAKIHMRPNMEVYFNAIDTDGDGIISSKEWAHFFNAINHRSKPGDAEKAFKILDTNKDGKLDLEEFCYHMFDFLYSQVESPSTYMFGKVA